MKFTTKKPHFEHLRQKWTSKHKKIQEDFWSLHKDSLKHLTVGSLGLLLMAPNSQQLPAPHLTFSQDNLLQNYDKNVLLAQELQKKLPKEVSPLDLLQEKEILGILNRNFDFKITAEIENIRLNRNYGLIGGEQHLYRYPGDTVWDHADSTVEWAKYKDAGIAPGLGAWGYFAYSKSEFTDKDKEREKYYLAIQTFLAPGFAENVGKYRDFFKYRKMLVVNTKTGQAVVGVVADAGPAEWTGKHLGGSPEVMDYVGWAQGLRKGPVLYFFIDDPEDKVPLGVVKVVDKV